MLGEYKHLLPAPWAFKGGCPCSRKFLFSLITLSVEEIAKVSSQSEFGWFRHRQHRSVQDCRARASIARWYCSRVSCWWLSSSVWRWSLYAEVSFQWHPEAARATNKQQIWQREFLSSRSSTVKRSSTRTAVAGTFLRFLQTIFENISLATEAPSESFDLQALYK